MDIMSKLEPAQTEASQDDIVLPFRTERSQAVGRLVRVGESVDTILLRLPIPMRSVKCWGRLSL